MPDYQFGLAEAHCEMAKLLRQQEQLEEACEHNEEALRILEPLVEQVPEYRGLLIGVQCELGKTLYRQGEWQAALAMLQKADQIQEDGLNWHRFVMAIAHWQLGDMEDARTVYWDAVSKTTMGSGNDEQRGLQTEAEQLLGISSEERVAFELDRWTNLIVEDPNHLEALRRRGDIYKNMQQWAKAIEDYTAVLEGDPRNAHMFNARSICHCLLQDFEAALQDANRAIELDPQSWMYSHRAWPLIMLSRHEEAVVDCNQSLELDPKSSIAFARRGWARHMLGEHRAAIVDNVAALKLTPSLNSAWRRLQTCSSEVQDPELLGALDELHQHLRNDEQALSSCEMLLLESTWFEPSCTQIKAMLNGRLPIANRFYKSIPRTQKAIFIGHWRTRQLENLIPRSKIFLAPLTSGPIMSVRI